MTVEVVELDFRRAGALGAARDAIVLWRRGTGFAPEVVVVESLGPDALLAVLLHRFLSAPLAVRVKGDLGREATEPVAGLSPLDRLARAVIGVSARLTLASADAVLPITPAVERDLLRVWCAAAASHVVPIASPEASTSRRPGPRRLLTVTNFAFWAKVEPLKRAVPMLVPVLESCDASWDIVGGGAHLARIRDSVAAHPRVRWLGQRPAAQFYREGPVLAYFSGLDGLPNVLLEGAAAGLAMVVNAGSAAAELVAPSGAALTVDLGDAAATRRAVHALLVDPERRAELGDRARAWVQETYAAPIVRRRLETVLRAVAAAGRP